MSGSAGRILALLLRHGYVLRSSLTRALEIAYWPTMQMLVWGFMSVFLAGKTSYVAQAFGVLLSGALLWDVLFRGQLGVCVSFLEEMWSRNLCHLFVSPLRPWEMMVGLMALSVMRLLIGIVPAAALCGLFYGFDVTSLGWPLLGFFVGLIVMGWGIGLVVCGLIMRYGMAAESLAWLLGFALMPVTGIYYPVAVLPEWLQALAWTLPSAYMFEGMRAVVVEGQFRADLMLQGLALDVVWLAGGCAGFMALFEAARRHGQLLQQGE